MSKKLRVYTAGALSFAFVLSQTAAPILSTLQAFVAPAVQAAHTQNQRIDTTPYTGATHYDALVTFHTDVFRPAGDGSNYQMAGIVYPPEWEAKWFDTPNYDCEETTQGHGNILCHPQGEVGPLTTENTGMPISIAFRVVGACGTTKEVATTVANGVVEVKHDHPKGSVQWIGNSPWVKTAFTFPPCPTGGGGSTPPVSGAYTCDAAGLKQAVADGKVRFDKVSDGNAFYTWNDTDCRFPITKGTFNILNTLSNQSLHHNAHDYIETGSQKVVWMVRPTTGCIWVQHDLVAGHQTLGQASMSLSAWENQVNFHTYGVSAYVWGGPCNAPASSAAASSVASSIAPVAQPSLTIQKSAPGGTFTPGSTITYTVTVTNVGQGEATDVYIDDPYVELSSMELVSHPNCSTWMSEGKTVLRCILGNLSANQSKSISLTFRIPTAHACNASGQTGNSVRNAAGTTGRSLNGTWLPPVWTPHVITQVTCPAASSFSSVTWSTGPISSSSSVAFSSVSWSGGPVSSSTSSYSVPASSSAGNTQTTLWIEKAVQESSTKPGQDLHYTLTVKNTGSIAAQNVYLDDFLHPHMFIAQLASQCSPGAGSVRCALGTLQPGQTVSKQLTLRTDVSHPCGNGAVARNSAAAVATNAANVPTPIIVTPVLCHASSVSSMSSSISSSVAPVPQCRDGKDNDYDGKVDASDPGCHYDGNPNNPGSYTPDDNDEWNAYSSSSSSVYSSMSSSISSSYPLPQCKDGYDNDGDYRIDAQDPGCHYDGNPNNPNSYTPYDNDERDVMSSSSSSTSFSSVPSSTDLSIYKAGPTGVIRGNSISYSLAVTNNGSVAAPNVVLTDPIPDSLQYLSHLSDSSCAQQGTTIVCQAGTVNPGQTKYVTLTFLIPHVQSCHQETVSNIAFVSSSIADGNPGNNHSAVVSTTVYCPHSSSSSSSSSSVMSSSSSSISSMSSTSSMSSASSVYLQQCRDNMDNDSDARIDIQDPGCHYDNNPNNPGSYIPYDDDERDTVMSSSSSSISSSSSSQGFADVSIIKTGPAQNMQYTPVSYAVQVTNNGNAVAHNVIVTDPIPSSFAFQPQLSDAACSLQGSNVLCSVGTLNPGQTKTIILAFKQDYVNVTCQQFSVQNVAIVNTSSQESNYNNNVSQPATTQMICGASSSSSSSSSSVSSSSSSSFSSFGCPACGSSSSSSYSSLSSSSVAPQSADLWIAKSGPATAYRGGVISYDIDVRNNGPLTAENVRVTDPIPDSLQFLPQYSDANCAQQGSTIICNGGSLGAGQQKRMTLSFLVPNQGTCALNIQNTASVASSVLDMTPGNNYSNTVSTVISCLGYPGGGGNQNASVNNNANTSVNNTINAGSSNTTVIQQNGNTSGQQNAGVNNSASTNVNNVINAGAANQTQVIQQSPSALPQVQQAAVTNTANTGVNNTVNAASQNQTGIWQQQQMPVPVVAKEPTGGFWNIFQMFTSGFGNMFARFF